MESTVNAEEELRHWKERYRALFEKNVAAVVITTPAGHMVDCNEVFTRMVGYDSREEVLALTAWDFYFNPRDRDAVISQSEVLENRLGEEFRLRCRNGMPRWVKAIRTVITRVNDRPELLQGTLIDITEQKKLEESRSEGANVRPPDNGERIDVPRAALPEESRTALVLDEVQGLLRNMNEALRPDKLRLLSKADVRDVALEVERLKFLLEELEIFRFRAELGR
jgi:PAS domain S-box-containing protein